MPGRDVHGAVKERVAAKGRRGADRPATPRAAPDATSPRAGAHAADRVFDWLAEQIVVGAIAPGAPLPPEREIAARHGVSRPVVRQATHRLARIGLVRVRQGGATIACDPAEASDPEVAVLVLRFGARREHLLLDIFERQLLGGYALLTLAERRATPDDLADLRAIVDAHAGGDLELDAFEERFWTRLADAGKNAIYRRETRFWFEALRDEPRNRHPVFGSLEQRVTIYRELLRRVGAKDGAAEAYGRLVGAMLEALHDRPRGRARSRRTARG